MTSAIRWMGMIMTLLAALSLSTARAASEYTFTDLGTLGGTGDSHAYGVNDRGQIVGDMMTTAGDIHGFMWTKGVVQDIGTLGGRYSRARALNNRGQVVGDASTASGEIHAFLWDHGAMRDLGTLGAASSAARAINDRGQIVGDSTTPAGDSHAFLWEHNHMTDLGAPDGGSSSALAINNARQIVGISYFPIQDAVLAVRWDGPQLTPLGTLSGDSQSVANSINNRGQIVGVSSGELSHAFLWRAGHLIGLASELSWANDINDHGQAAGTWQASATSPSLTSVWKNGLRTTLPIPGDRAGDAMSINNRGAVVGWALIPGQGVHAALWLPAHEHE